MPPGSPAAPSAAGPLAKRWQKLVGRALGLAAREDWGGREELYLSSSSD